MFYNALTNAILLVLLLFEPAAVVALDIAVFDRTDVVADSRYGAVAQVDLSSANPILSFEFFGRSFKTRPEAMLYRYRLVGYEDQWKNTQRPGVEYQDLPTGEYVFEVVAIDREKQG